MNYVAIAPTGKRLPRNITAGKPYAMLDAQLDPKHPYGGCFYINNDAGDRSFCLPKDCAHLGGQDWIIREAYISPASVSLWQRIKDFFA